jgi:hypothetical protein
VSTQSALSAESACATRTAQATQATSTPCTASTTGLTTAAQLQHTAVATLATPATLATKATGATYAASTTNTTGATHTAVAGLTTSTTGDRYVGADHNLACAGSDTGLSSASGRSCRTLHTLLALGTGGANNATGSCQAIRPGRSCAIGARATILTTQTSQTLATCKARFAFPTNAAVATGLTALPCGRRGDVAHLLVTGDGLGANSTRGGEHRDGQGGRQGSQPRWHRPHNTGQHCGRCGKCATLNTLAGHGTTSHKISEGGLQKVTEVTGLRELIEIIKKSITLDKMNDFWFISLPITKNYQITINNQSRHWKYQFHRFKK